MWYDLFVQNWDIFLLYLRPFLLLFVVYLVAKLVGWFLERLFDRLVALRIHIDPTLAAILRRIVIFIIYSVGIMEIIMEIPQLQSLAYSLFAGAGLIAIIVGYAGKDILSNILSGVVIALFQPFKINDNVLFRGDYGFVEDITLRHTVIRTRDNRRIIVPNSMITSEEITNYSAKDPTVKKFVDVGISYDSSIDMARDIMLDEAKKHPDILRHKTKKADHRPRVFVEQLADFSVVMRLEFWTEDEEAGYQIARALRESIKKRFDKAGIEIPFPYRTIVYKKQKRK
ncbi:mechanosensitive ion channel family protein [Candidatus Woesearchaeota archaeon]|nr:mechanosensitive ion channel family protein [Candidatus Woesearchaeota archaeon]